MLAIFEKVACGDATRIGLKIVPTERYQTSRRTPNDTEANASLRRPRRRPGHNMIPARFCAGASVALVALFAGAAGVMNFFLDHHFEFLGKIHEFDRAGRSRPRQA